tara:strand:+ start:393 stop:635 length:243 start_codon:yes stop_codon:yes gene_type:complete
MIDEDYEEYWALGIWEEIGEYSHSIANDSAIPSDKIDSHPEMYEQILQRRALQQIAQELSKLTYLLKTQIDASSEVDDVE